MGLFIPSLERVRAMTYLKIENTGESDPQAFTLLGASTKRGSDTAIGQFGSGTKFGLAVLLRNNVYPTIYCGTTRLEFGLREPGFAGAREIYCSTNGGAGKNLGFCVEYGEIDWTDVSMALREYISNAIDAGGYSVEIVADNQVRAKSGFTRVFITMDLPAIGDFYRNRAKWFLHYGTEADLHTPILQKGGRNMGVNSGAMVYRRGVLIREVKEEQSLFDYNFHDISIDEARKLNDHTVRWEAGKLLSGADIPIIGQYLLSFTSDKSYWEQGFSQYCFSPNHKAKWQEAAKKYLPGKVFATRGSLVAEYARRKGFDVLEVPMTIANIFYSTFGLEMADNVLDSDEKFGRVVTDPHPDALSATQCMWERLKYKGSKPFPTVKGFDQNMQGGILTKGYYRDGTIYINNSMTPGASLELYQTIVEEIAHHITGALDNSRDFQDYVIKELAHSLI